jgi:phage shock protein PspC (stress-responsive transcriptional regulator)
MKEEDEMTMGTGEVRRAVRRQDGKVIAGVAAGLGDYFRVDPLWFRLGFVALTFAAGTGVIAYGVLWLLMPRNAAAGPTSLHRRADALASSFRGTPSWIGAALVIVGGVVLLSSAMHWHAPILWGIALILGGIALFTRHEQQATTTTVAPEPSPPATPSLESTAVTVEQPRVAPKRERSGLGWLTIGAALLATGVAALLDGANVVGISLVQYLAVPLAILGIGMLVGTLYGRARWLAAPALLLTPFVLAASLVHVPFKGGSGDVVYRPATVSAVRPVYRLTAGQLTIDLRALALTAPVSIRATAVAGHILVYVPPGATLNVRGRAGGGEVSLFGRTFDGFNIDVRRSFGPPSPHVITLDLEASLGQVEVES